MEREEALELLRQCADRKIELTKAVYQQMLDCLQGMERTDLKKAARLRDIRVVDR